MKILTTKAQERIRENRDALYQYIQCSNASQEERISAIKALLDISYDCGIKDYPEYYGRACVYLKEKQQ